jgi:hypothetical protein
VLTFLIRRFRWMIVGAGVKYVARRGMTRSVDEAASRIEDRLPAPVANAVNALPGDVMKAGGAAVVSARAVQRGAIVTQRGAKAGGVVVTRVTRVGIRRPRPEVADRIRQARAAVAEQAERDSRDLRADFQRYVRGGGPAGERAALDALLDRRSQTNELPLPTVPDPVDRGRRRSLPPRPRPEVARMQRSYRRPQKPWDLRRRRDLGPESRAVS